MPGSRACDPHLILVAQVPDSIDWISVDRYHKDTDDGYVDKLRHNYKSCIYPKLNSYQKVAVSPRIGCDQDPSVTDCPDPDSSSKSAKTELSDAKEFVKWQQDDDTIAMISPYRLDDLVENNDDYDDLRKFWYDYGKATK